MSKVTHEYKALVAQLDDRQLERKVKDMQETCTELQTQIDYGRRELRRRRKDTLRVR